MIPIRDQILIKPFAGDEISEGGIFVPISVRKPSNKGVVVAIGNGTAKKKMQFKEGDRVFRVKSWGQEVLVNGELHYIMSQDAILALE
jgi:chaperonin GroES